MRISAFSVLLLSFVSAAAAAGKCSCLLSDIMRFLAESLTYIAVAFLILSAIVYFVERGRIGKEGVEATGADSVKTMMLFLRDVIATFVFLLYLIFLFSCLYFAADLANRFLLPWFNTVVGGQIIPALMTDWTARIIAIVVIPVFLWLLVEGKIRIPRSGRFVLGALSPTNKFSSTVMAPLLMLSGILFISWSNVGGPIPFTLFLAAVLLGLQLLVLKELLRRNLENMLTNHIVAAANLSPIILGALMLESKILACSC
jgi:hypothetical protein